MQKILVSACLLGEKVRYNGTGKLLSHPAIVQWQKENRLIPVCPEVSGGLTTPREPAEIQSDQSVLTSNGTNVSAQFNLGAQIALNLCHRHKIQYALLKARSPSCGNEKVYNGKFTNSLVDGIGITASLLMENGIRVFNEEQIEQLVAALRDSAQEQPAS